MTVSPHVNTCAQLFAFVRARGPAWEGGRQMQDQRAWREHAAFMNALAARGFIVLGGPLGDGQRVLIIVEAQSEQAIHEQFALDPWVSLGLLRTESIQPWTVLLDRNASSPPRTG